MCFHSGVANANMDVPIEQQVEYGQVLEHLHRQCLDKERNLTTLALILKDEGVLRKLVHIVSHSSTFRLQLCPELS